MSEPAAGRTRGAIARQGTLVFGGYSFAQLLAFVRNAALGHLLAMGDFGTAAALTITLQTLETVSDLALDRMIVQSADGDDPRLLASAHFLSVLRGAVLAALLWLAAPFAAAAFQLQQHVAAFELIALIPLIKGFTHLGCRQAQRRLDNRGTVLVEVLPQLGALALTYPLVLALGDFRAVVWLAVAHAVLSLAVSHAVTAVRYDLRPQGAAVLAMARFGWPILLSALSVLAVYQGDRIIVGGFYGLEALAGYTVAFLITMVPGALAARAGMTLMLPLLAEARADGAAELRRFRLMCELTALAAALYVVGLAIAGGYVVMLTFSAKYAGLGELIAALALMWGLRMVQAPAGALLMARGDTLPLLIAACIRATALAPALLLAWAGADIALLALTGAAGELATLGYVAVVLGAGGTRLGVVLISRTLFVLAAGFAALPLVDLLARSDDLPAASALLVSVAAAVTLIGGAAFGGLRSELRELATEWGAAARQRRDVPIMPKEI